MSVLRTLRRLARGGRAGRGRALRPLLGAEAWRAVEDFFGRLRERVEVVDA